MQKIQKCYFCCMGWVLIFSLIPVDSPYQEFVGGWVYFPLVEKFWWLVNWNKKCYRFSYSLCNTCWYSGYCLYNTNNSEKELMIYIFSLTQFKITSSYCVQIPAHELFYLLVLRKFLHYPIQDSFSYFRSYNKFRLIHKKMICHY